MIDDDLDAPEDFEQDVGEKPSLREIWDNNPALKVGAIVLAVAVGLGGYFLFFKSGPITGAQSLVRIHAAGKVKRIPGKQALDPAYRKAVEQANKQEVKQAEATGGSAIPSPVAVSKQSGLKIPQIPQAPQSDILAEWRRVANAAQVKSAQHKIQMESAPPPAAVPVVKPITPHVVLKPDPKLTQLLEKQMRVILMAQRPDRDQTLKITSGDTPYEKHLKEQNAEARNMQQSGGGVSPSSSSGQSASGGASSTTGADKMPAKIIVPQGSVAYAQLLNQLDSDVPGPVLAQMLSGPFAGGRLIGTVKKEHNYMVISFNAVVKNTVSYKISAIALDANTTLTGQATSVDHHYITRVVLPAAAAFLTGYASARSQTQQTQTSSTTATTTQNAQPTMSQSINKGIESASQSVSQMLEKGAQRPVTVIVAKGTAMGVFFTKAVTTKDAQ